VIGLRPSAVIPTEVEGSAVAFRPYDRVAYEGKNAWTQLSRRPSGGPPRRHSAGRCKTFPPATFYL